MWKMHKWEVWVLWEHMLVLWPPAGSVCRSAVDATQAARMTMKRIAELAHFYCSGLEIRERITPRRQLFESLTFFCKLVLNEVKASPT